LEELPPSLTLKSTTTKPSFGAPKGYFQIFGLDPRTPENIDENLTTYYRALALKWHPDKTAMTLRKLRNLRSSRPHIRYFQILSNAIVT
jgi:hypothetical protein